LDPPLLDIRDLKVFFYTYRGVVRAVNGVNLTISRKEVVSLVGETGCGKTCTALAVMRLIRPPGKIVGGEILLEGKNLLSISEEEMRNLRGSAVAMMFQNPGVTLNPAFKVGDQIAETIVLHQHMSKQEATREAERYLRDMGIPSPERRLSDYPHEFSIGMRQRIMIAIALSCNPSLLIADEPTTGLDVTIQAQILDLLTGLRAKHDMSILYITHNLGVVAQISERVGVMYAGEIVEFADVESIFHRYRHPYTEGLVRAIPKLSSNEKLREIPGSVPSLINLPEGCPFANRCYRAQPTCRKQHPGLIELEKGHFVACHFPVER
jgi:peptide/nickel transport system ATP-binding protein